MSGGGSQVTAATPWGAAQPYLTDIMSQAKGLYGQLAPFYANPASNFTYGNTTGAVGNIVGGTSPFGSMASSLSPATTQAIQQQLSGTPDYTAVKGALDAANQQTWDSFNNQFIPQLNQRASFLSNPSGAIKDLNWATANIGRNMDLSAQQQYLGLEEAAKQRQAAAAGLGANIAQGAGAQTLQGANLFGSLSQLPQSNLADYAGIVSQTGGKFGTDTTSMKPSGAQTAANVIGGLTAGAGLLNSVFGTGSGATTSLAGKVGGLLSGGAVDTSGAMAGALGDIGSTTSAGLASTASDVAAANEAYLASQAGTGAASGLAADTAGLGGGTAAGADAAGTVGGADAGASGGASSGLGAIAPYAAAALAVAAPFYGLVSSPYSMSAKYYSDIGNMLSQGRPADPNGQYTYDAAVAEITRSAQHGDQAAITLANQYGIPWQTAGLTPANYQNYSMPGGAGRSLSIVSTKK